MSLFQSTYKSSEANIPPDHIYLNGSLYDDNFTVPSLPQYVPAEITQTRNSPFLDNCSSYNMAITRFAISADALPRVTQPLITTTSTTFWYVGVSYNGIFYDQPILLPILSDPQGNQARIVYSIQAFIDLINTAWLAAQTAAIAAGAPSGAGQVFMSFEKTTGFYNINVPTWYGLGLFATVPGDGIGVNMSLGLYDMFGSYNAFLPRGPTIVYNHHEVTIRRELTGFNNIDNIEYPTYGATGDYIQLSQDAALPSSVMNVHRLLITTTTLPVYPEFIAPLFTSNNTTSGNSAMKVVTDFYIGHDGILENDNSTFKYVSTLYRLISLTGSTPLSNWDLKVYYVTADNQIFPLYIPPGGEFDIKLVFLKKGLTS